MRQGQQHRRGRGRHGNNGHRKGQNPLTRSFESNGPDVKVRGTPAHIAEKYISLARDAQSSGDPVLAENYLQHAEHYNRIILAFREQQALQGGGESMNGNGQHGRVRQPGEPLDGEEFADDDGQGDDFGQGDQPTITRFPHEAQSMQRSHEGRSEEGGQAPQWTPRQHDNQQGRFRDRYERHHDRQDRDRGERQDRHFDRQDRGDRDRYGDRGDRFDRQHGGGHHDRGGSGERDRQQRFGDRQQRFDRRDRYHEDRGHQPMQRDRGGEPPVVAVDDQPIPEPRLEPRESAPVPVAAPVQSEAPAPRSARGEGGQRRRERFGPGIDEPEFLRRPVRRSKREQEPSEAPESQSVTDEPSRE